MWAGFQCLHSSLTTHAFTGCGSLIHPETNGDPGTLPLGAGGVANGRDDES